MSPKWVIYVAETIKQLLRYEANIQSGPSPHPRPQVKPCPNLILLSVYHHEARKLVASAYLAVRPVDPKTTVVAASHERPLTADAGTDCNSAHPVRL